MANTSHASDCGSLRLRVVGVDWGCGGQASRDIYGRCAGSRGNGHGFRTNRGCCPECEELSKKIEPCPLRNLETKHLGHPLYGSLCLLTTEALSYLFPRLLEITLTGSLDKNGDPILEQYLGVLCINTELKSNFQDPQRGIVIKSLDYISKNMSSVVEAWCYERDLEEACAIWNT